MFLYKNLSFSISSVISIPIMLIGINGGYFPAICRVCLRLEDELWWFSYFNSRTAIAGAIIGLLLVFYDSKRSIGFLKVFFYRKYYSFRRCFDLKRK